MKRAPRRSLAVFGILLGIAACSKSSKAPTQPPSSPMCQLSSTTLEFGSVALGRSDTMSLSISNTGTDTLTGTLTTGCPEYGIVGSPAFTLAAGHSKTVGVRFTPATTGQSSCALLSGTSCGQVALRGQGRTARSEVSPGQLDFGRNRPDERIAFRLTNTGTTTLAGTVTSSCANFSLFGPVNYSLSPGQDQLFQVSFTPRVPGPQSCGIQTGAADSPTVSCTGFGQYCSVAPTSLFVGSAWHWIDQSFTITDTDSFPLVGAVAENYGEISIAPSLSYNLPSGDAQQFTVQWTPQLPFSAGIHTYVVDTGIGTCPDVSINANGDAVDAVVHAGCIFPVAGTVTDFGTLHVGQAVTLPLSLTNSCGSGEDPFTVNAVEFSGDLQVSPALFSNFAPGETRAAQVSFTPSQAGQQYIRVQFYSGNANYANRARAELLYRATVLP